MSENQVFVGIDVAKAQLDIALRPTGDRWTVPNEEASIASLVAQLQAAHPTLIVLEATGGVPTRCRGRARGGSPARRGGQSPPGPGFCESDGAVGQNGSG